MIALSDEQKNRLLYARGAEEAAALMKEAGVDAPQAERIWNEISACREEKSSSSTSSMPSTAAASRAGNGVTAISTGLRRAALPPWKQAVGAGAVTVAAALRLVTKTSRPVS